MHDVSGMRPGQLVTRDVGVQEDRSEQRSELVQLNGGVKDRKLVFRAESERAINQVATYLQLCERGAKERKRINRQPGRPGRVGEGGEE